MRVLIIEDDKDLFHSILEKNGNFEVLHAELKKIEDLINSQSTIILPMSINDLGHSDLF